MTWKQKWNIWLHKKRMQQTGTKWGQVHTRLGWEGDPLGIVQEIKISPYNQMVYAQTRIRPWKKKTHKILWDVKIQTDHPILARRLHLIFNWQEKKNLSSSGPQSESEIRRKVGQMPGPCQGADKLWDVRVTVIPIVVRALGTIPNYLKKRLDKLEVRGRIKTI